MNTMAAATVTFCMNGVAPELPKTVWLEPPKAAPMLAPLPFCNNTIIIRAMQTRMCKNMRISCIDSTYPYTYPPLKEGENWPKDRRIKNSTKITSGCNKNYRPLFHMEPDDRDESVRFQARPSHKSTVNIGHRHQVFGVIGFHASPIEDSYVFCST
jgi:hypothetical protein